MPGFPEDTDEVRPQHGRQGEENAGVPPKQWGAWEEAVSSGRTVEGSVVGSWRRGDGDLRPLTEGGGNDRRILGTPTQRQRKQEAEVRPAGAWELGRGAAGGVSPEVTWVRLET